jgi:hypothetical protein
VNALTVAVWVDVSVDVWMDVWMCEWMQSLRMCTQESTVSKRVNALTVAVLGGCVDVWMDAEFAFVHGKSLDYREAGYGKLSELLVASSSVLTFVKNASSGIIYPAGAFKPNLQCNKHDKTPLKKPFKKAFYKKNPQKNSSKEALKKSMKNKP